MLLEIIKPERTRARLRQRPVTGIVALDSSTRGWPPALPLERKCSIGTHPGRDDTKYGLAEVISGFPRQWGVVLEGEGAAKEGK